MRGLPISDELMNATRGTGSGINPNEKLCALRSCRKPFVPQKFNPAQKYCCEQHGAKGRSSHARFGDPRLPGQDPDARYFVTAVTGWAITDEGKANGPAGISYSVCDDARNGLEVATFYAGKHQPNEVVRKRRAFALAEELNSDERDWENSEGKYAPGYTTKARPEKCLHGHAMTPENVYETFAGSWECKTCRRASRQRHNQRKRELRLERLAAEVESDWHGDAA